MSRASSAQSKTLLVTGAGGYIGLNVLHLLAKEPHRIRAAVRNVNDAKRIEPIKRVTANSKFPVEFVSADLLKPETWAEAVKGVDIVFHLASPYPNSTPKDVENELIRPAVEGTLNVLKASFAANVSRVVLTSSTASIYTFSLKDKTFTEADWPDPEKSYPYPKSKTLAEKAAWDFVAEKKKNNEKCFELAVINPSIVHGPTLGGGDSLGTSELAIANLFGGKTEKISQFHCGHCDVRDVALAHVRAAFVPEAAGHRHIIVSEAKWFSLKRGADILAREFGPQGYQVCTAVEPKDDPNNSSDNTRMVKVLGITPIDYAKTVVDMANSLIALGVIKK